MQTSPLLIATIFVAATASCLAGDRATALQSALEAVRVDLNAPGVSGAVVFPDGTLWTGTAGQATVGVPTTVDMAFETGSITKLYTAATVLALVDRGVLALDEPLAAWVPEFPNADTVSLRQLLQHTSGLYNVHDDPEFYPRLFMDPARRWRAEEVLEGVREPYFQPGEGWRYSNTNYLLLGLVIERAGKQSVASAMRAFLFEPLGLENTWFAAEEPVAAPRAHAFMDFSGDDTVDDITAMMPDTAFLTAHSTAGAVMATAADVARFVHDLFNGKVLSASMQEQLLSFIDRPDGKQYGLGVLREQWGEIIVFGHRGNSIGFSAVTWHVPESGVSLSILANLHATVIHPGDQQLLSAALGRATTQQLTESTAMARAEDSAGEKDHEAVIRLLEPQVKANPEYRQALIQLSRAYISSLSATSPVRTYRRSKLLVEHLERAIELDPSDSEPRWLLMNFYLQAPAMVGGDRAKALAIAEAMVEIDREWGYRALERYYRHTRQGAQADHYAKLLTAQDK